MLFIVNQECPADLELGAPLLSLRGASSMPGMNAVLITDVWFREGCAAVQTMHTSVPDICLRPAAAAFICGLQQCPARTAAS